MNINEQQKETLVAWLNDAHAMEQGLIKTLEKQIEDTKDKPNMQPRLKQHLDETKRHASLVQHCIERYGESVSSTKDFMSKTSAAVSGLTMSFMEDEMVKNVHSAYAAEHFEIATYTLLQAAAEELDDTETASVCADILKDEEAMAAWLLEQLPSVTTQHLAKLT